VLGLAPDRFAPGPGTQPGLAPNGTQPTDDLDVRYPTVSREQRKELAAAREALVIVPAAHRGPSRAQLSG